jgi:hypothetical protein
MSIKILAVTLALVLGVSQASVIKPKSIGNCRKYKIEKPELFTK